MTAPRLRVEEIRLFERPVKLRMPFRFGVVTLTEAAEAYVHVRIALGSGREAWGMAAEMLAPKWFDKDTTLSNEDNFEQLRASLRIARHHYMEDRTPRTAFDLFAATYGPQIETCAGRGLNRLIAGYGPALIDRAVLDAICRAEALSFDEAMRVNVPGIAPGDLVPELSGFDLDRFLRRLTPADHIDARHTVGMVDPITAADQASGTRIEDGLPETLDEVVATYGHRYFKLKVGGDLPKDLARLTSIASVLDRSAAPYHVTLDGNEQYTDVGGILELWEAMETTPALGRLTGSTLFIEQPINRKTALDQDVTRLATRRPVIIDESDDDLDAFPKARACGYLGVSSKTCKGVYKSLLNRARCALWNDANRAERYFMSAEDLTTQAGVSVQQDLALVSLIGLTHVERNAHHYVNGMAARPAAEQRAFLHAHGDLYREDGGTVRLRIEEGRLAIGSLRCRGFATGAEPEWASMSEMPK